VPSPTTRTTQTGAQPVSMLTVAAFAFGLAAVWLVPPITGAVGIGFGGVALARRKPWAKHALIVAVVGTVVGVLLHMLPESFLQ
jgi:membrane protein DedA with SNARE-associated domain